MWRKRCKRPKPQRRSADRSARVAARAGASAQKAPDAARPVLALRDAILIKLWRVCLRGLERGHANGELQIAPWYVSCLRKQGPHPAQYLTMLPAHLARVIMGARRACLQAMIAPWGAHSYGEQLLHSCDGCGAAPSSEHCCSCRECCTAANAALEHSMFDCEEPVSSVPRPGSVACRWLRSAT